jgi:hypothetical protein
MRNGPQYSTELTDAEYQHRVPHPLPPAGNRSATPAAPRCVHGAGGSAVIQRCPVCPSVAQSAGVQPRRSGATGWPQLFAAADP